MKEAKKNSLLTVSIILLIFLLVINLIIVFSFKVRFGVTKHLKIEPRTSKDKAVRLELIIINPNCKICPTLQSVISELSQYNIEIIKNQTLTIDQAESLITEYGIKRLPALLLKGEVNKTILQSFNKVKDALVYETTEPPFVNAETRNIEGLVSYIIIKDDSCKQCINMSLLVQALQRDHIVFSKPDIINFEDARAKGLLKEYNISRLPCLLLSKDIDVYSLSKNLLRAGFVLKNNYYLFESPPPYIEVSTGNLRGLVSLIMLNDSSCKECYNVELHKQLLSRFGLIITNETVIDINSNRGRELVALYNITQVPTIILKGDVGVYTSLKKAWSQVGTIENNVYIFRNLTLLKATYKDIAKGMKGIIVTPKQQAKQ